MNNVYVNRTLEFIKKFLPGRKITAKYLLTVMLLWYMLVDIRVLLYKPWKDRNKVRAFVEKLPSEEGIHKPTRESNAERLRIVKNACRYLGYNETANNTDIRAHMSPNKTVLYCRINRCGSSATLEVMRQLFDCDANCLLKNGINVKNDPATAFEIMKKAFSFVVVREPYERFLSTYGNIFYLPKKDWLSRGTQVIQKVRENPSEISLKYGNDVTFTELIKYVVDRYENSQFLDEPFRPIRHISCNPCMYHFDYIAKLETFQSDWDILLEEWRSKEIIGDYPPDIISKFRLLSFNGPLTHLFTTIGLLKNSGIHVHSLFVRTWTYFQMIGVISKYVPIPYLKEEIGKVDIRDFKKTLLNAIELTAAENRDATIQKIEALRQAYSAVPMDYMERLAKMVRDDCLLYGYDERPAFLFDRVNYKYNESGRDFDYFKGLNG